MHHAIVFLTVSSNQLLVTSRESVLELTINRPEKRNALSLRLLDELGATLATHAMDADLKCAVITAAGDRCFAAGGDLTELDTIRSRVEAEAMSRRGRHALDRIRDFPLPVVGALNGLALGGGAELAMACDMRVAAAHAAIGFLHAQLNLTTAWGGGIDLVAAVGSQRALELLLSARRIAAPEAHEIGLVDRVCPPEQPLAECVQEFLQQLLIRSHGVLRGFKALVAARRRSLHEQLAAVEQAHFVDTWTDADHWAAVERAVSDRRNDTN